MTFVLQFAAKKLKMNNNNIRKAFECDRFILINVCILPEICSTPKAFPVLPQSPVIDQNAFKWNHWTIKELVNDLNIFHM